MLPPLSMRDGIITRFKTRLRLQGPGSGMVTIDHHLGKRSIFAIEPLSYPFSVWDWHDRHCGVSSA